MIRALNRADAAAVARDLRPEDAAEIWATRWGCDPEALAAQIADNARLGAIVAAADGAAVAVVAAIETWPGMWSVGFFATARWPEVAHEASGWIKRQLGPALIAAGARRAECHALAGRPGTRRWLEWLGAAPEASVPGFGKNGEEFIRYAWLRGA